MFVLTLVVYVFTAPGHIQAVDVGQELDVAESIVANHSITIPINDGGLRGSHGQVVSGHAIGESILLLPAALAGQLAGSARGSRVATAAASLLNPIAAALTVLVLFLFAVELGAGMTAAVFLGLIFGFASLEWPYAHDSYDVTPTGLCLLVGLLGLYAQARRPRIGWLALSGTAVGFAVLLRIPTIICLPVFLGYLLFMLRRRPALELLRMAAVWSVPIVLALAISGWYNWLRFGSPVAGGYGPDQVSFSYPLQMGLAGFLLSPGKSIFLFSPVLFLGIAGFRLLYRQERGLAVVIVALIILNLGFYARLAFWAGDWAWGPRYLVPLVAFALLPAIFVLHGWAHASLPMRTTIVVIVALSLVPQVLGVVLDYQVQMAIMQQHGDLQASPWRVGSSQLLAHARALADVVAGTASYPSSRLGHDVVSGRPSVTTWDFWWVYAWLEGFSRLAIVAAMAALAACGVAATAWLARLLGTTRDRQELGEVEVAYG